MLNSYFLVVAFVLIFSSFRCQIMRHCTIYTVNSDDHYALDFVPLRSYKTARINLIVGCPYLIVAWIRIGYRHVDLTQSNWLTHCTTRLMMLLGNRCAC